MSSISAAAVLAAVLFSGHAAPARVSGPPPPGPAAGGSSLFAQSAAETLDREFAGDEPSFLLLDAHSGALLASHWPDAEQPIPLGSLVKPFAALAYAEHHAYRYPVYECHGTAGGCWQPRPHGRLTMASALAYSCNSYFRALTSHLSGEQMREVAAQFSLDPPSPELAGAPLMGMGDEWRITPLRMARAYLELNRRRAEPGVREILSGLAESAQWGTGSAVGRGLTHSAALVKTGTAPCRHEHSAPGDGFVIALVPAEKPELLLMVRVHGVPGARAAETAGRMLARVER